MDLVFFKNPGYSPGCRVNLESRVTVRVKSTLLFTPQTLGRGGIGEEEYRRLGDVFTGWCNNHLQLSVRKKLELVMDLRQKCWPP